MDRDSARGEHPSHVGRRGRHPVNVLEKASRQYEADLAIGERQLFGDVCNPALRDVGVRSELISGYIDSYQVERMLGGQTVDVRAVATTAEIGHDTSFRETGHLVLHSSEEMPDEDRHDQE